MMAEGWTERVLMWSQGVGWGEIRGGADMDG